MSTNPAAVFSPADLAAQVAELRTQAEQLRRDNEQLTEQLARSREAVGLLAREFRNALVPVVCAAELIDTLDSVDSELKGPCRLIARGGRHFSSMVNDLHDVLRVTRGVGSFEPEPTSFKEATERVIEQFQPVISAAGQMLAISLPYEPMTLLGDAARLEEIVCKLLDNAVRYTDTGGLIRVTLTRQGSSAVLQVRDNGRGIMPELLPRVFELFVQGDGRLQETHRGMGVGLTLVQALVELHGGTVEARSAGVGQGSEFVVRLPLQPEEFSIPAVRETDPTRLLIVSRVADGAELAKLISEWGHETVVASDSDEALRVAAELLPEVVLLEVEVPALEGAETARRLRATVPGSQMMLVALGGHGTFTYLYEHRDLFDASFMKPVDPDELRALLED